MFAHRCTSLTTAVAYGIRACDCVDCKGLIRHLNLSHSANSHFQQSNRVSRRKRGETEGQSLKLFIDCADIPCRPSTQCALGQCERESRRGASPEVGLSLQTCGTPPPKFYENSRYLGLVDRMKLTADTVTAGPTERYPGCADTFPICRLSTCTCGCAARKSIAHRNVVVVVSCPALNRSAQHATICSVLIMTRIIGIAKPLQIAFQY